MSDSKNLTTAAQQRARLAQLLGQQAGQLRRYPLSYSQQRLWFLDQLAPESPVYNIPTVLRLAGPLDLPALERSLGEIIRRHESLRTALVELEGEPAQVVWPAAAFTLPVTDLGAVPLEEAQSLLIAEARRPFDLRCGPLFRANLIRLGPDEHLLQLTMHHIGSDGWSTGVLFRELSALYGAYVEQRPSPLAPLPIQYGDYARWQRRTLQGQELAEHRSYWLNRLAGKRLLLDLPSDRPRPPVQSLRGDIVRLTVPPELTAPLKALSRLEGASLFMLLLAAFQVLLHRYTGQEEVLVGTPVAGRDRPETEGLIGLFVNTIVMRADFAGAPTFRELLAQVRAAATEAYAHQAMPFEQLVQALQPERAMSHAPVVQAAFALQSDLLPTPDLPGLTVTRTEVATGTAKLDLSLSLEEAAGGLSGWLEYNADLFDEATVARMSGHYRTLLEGIAADPDQPVTLLPLLTAGERERFDEWNRTEMDDPRDRCVHELVAEQAADALAVAAPDGCLTYGELNRAAAGLAGRLAALGAGPSRPVAVWLERSAAMVAGWLAAMKAGAAYIPLDPVYPPERVARILAETKAAALVTRPEMAASLPDGGCPIVSPGEHGTVPVTPARPADLAYVIYTSGSTGTPKGAAVEHRSLMNLVTWAHRTFGTTPADRVAQVVGPAFDAAVFEVWPTLAAGATLCLPDDEVRTAPEQLRDWLIREQITVALAPTPLAERLLALQWPADGSLRVMQTGGDKLTRRPAPNLPFPLYNVYGPTECTVITVAGPVAPAGTEAGLPHIGRAVRNTRLHVLDRNRQPVPIGVPGELYISGDSVGRGYLARPDLTEQAFVTVAGARCYRTGDLVRYRPDGNLEFLGRLDRQVKLHGLRIEPGEIEAVLQQHPAVRETAVILRDAGAEPILVACVAGDGVDAADLREHLKAKLPAYMIPAAFIFLPALPLTTNGKVDRRALLALEPDLPVEKGALTPVEELLCGMWAELLGREQIGPDANFFELGGHSLLATQVVARVRRHLGVELPVRALFDAPTVRTLAARIEAGRRPAAAPPLEPVARDGDLPLSFAQERLWVLNQLEPGARAYHIPVLFRLVGPADAVLLERAINDLVQRHEALRTTFPVVGDRPVQRIATAPAPVELRVVDLQHLPEASRAEQALQQAQAVFSEPFDLAAGPLLRTALFRLGPADHLFLAAVHHIVGDGWSLGVFCAELGQIYAALADGRPSPLAPLPLQYADYACWQRRWLQGEALEAQLAYWRRQLSDSPEMLELPKDRQRPAVRRFRSGSATIRLPEATTRAIKQLSRREGATLFMTLLAAFQLLLHRLTGQAEIRTGAPVANRNRAETAGLIGFFLNTLVLRTDFAGNPTFKELLARVRETAFGAYDHQDIPFEKLLEALQPERSLSSTPLFQVMFNMLNFTASPLELPGVQAHPVQMPGMESHFDMTLYAREADQQLEMELVYNADLFGPARIAEMGRQLTGLLEQIAAAPEQPVGQYSLVTPEARRVLPDPTEPLSDAWLGSVCERFSARARRAPERTAATDPSGSWTYGELEAAANRLAHWLRAGGVATGDRVAVYAHRSSPLVLALNAILKAGAAFVALDPAYPAPSLIDRLQLAAPRAFIALEAAGPVPEPVSAELDQLCCQCRICLPPGVVAKTILTEYDETPPAVAIGPDDLAYIAFTSGSTGRPKGIMGRHGSLTHFLPWLEETFGFVASDRFSMLSGLAHDPLHRDIFQPLQLGAAVAIPDPDQMFSPGYLARWMAAEGVTMANMTPAMGQLLTQASGVRIPSLRYCFPVGDVLTRRDVSRLKALAPNVTIVNFYGSTETQRAVSYHVVTDTEATGAEKEVVPLGRGMQDVQLLVLNSAGHLAGVGEPGELYFRSPHMALGYFGAEELTRERFLVNPFTGIANDAVYRTGDLGRYLPDGAVEPMGRADFQVKIRGYRVELGEVEGALRQHAAVREAVVVAREDAPGEKRLVAYVVPAVMPPPAPADLRGYMSGRLPDYMVPAAFVVMAALPLNPNGKVDRKALPAPTWGEPDAAAFAEPSGPVEQAIATIWAELLGQPRIARRANFFAMGGHSLLGARVIARLQDAFGIQVPLRALFEAPTVAGLAELIATMPGRATSEGIPVRNRADGPAPLSFQQQRLWFLEKLEPGSAAYNLPGAVRLHGRLDVGALERSLSELVRRHEALRTTFSLTEPVQVIAPPAPVVLPVTDLRHLPVAEREAAALKAAAAEARRPFHLAAGPLMRVRLITLAEAEQILVVVLHHMVADGWSKGVFLRELAACYGESAALPELTRQYQDYAAWQREQLDFGAQLDYWREQLAGAPGRLELPTDRPRPAVQTFRGATRPVALPPDLVGALESLCRRENATLFMALLTAFQTLLSRYAGQTDIVVGTPVAGRPRPELEPLIGFFTGTLALRTDLPGDLTFTEALARVRETALGAFAHQDVPLEKLIETLQPERNLGHSPLFQVMFGLQNTPYVAVELPGLRMTELPLETGAAKFDLTLNLGAAEGRVAGALEYNSDLFDAATIDRMIGHFLQLLRGIAADPGARLSALPLLTAAEAEQLRAWNGVTLPVAEGLTIHGLIERQVARTPDATAISAGDTTWSYRELNQRADGLAACLQAQGVGPDTPVGMLMDRSPLMVAALLGILKAGGAYVPLDPTYPAERLAFMIEDSGLPVLVTERSLAGLIPLPAGIQVVIADEAVSQQPVAATNGKLAYVIYTSGSTGKPKGALIQHSSAVNLLLNMARELEFTAADAVLGLTAISFDIAALELWLTLSAGARLVLTKRDAALDGGRLARTIAQTGVTLVQATPVTFRLLLAAGWRPAAPLKLLSAGEPLTAELAAALTERGARLWNGYGPTETTVYATVHRVVPGEAPVPIGHPLANCQAWVLDGHRQPVPVGVVGELYMGGRLVGRGYLNRPDLTAERFCPDPFSNEPGARLYRTGDLVSRRPDGLLLCHGRVDHQVKLRGYRIELGEIEATLRQHPLVSDAAVILREDQPGDRRLAAYLVARTDTEIAIELSAVRQFLKEKLPDYMLPAAYVLLPALPLTPARKVDRRALPVPEATRAAVAVEYVAPRSELEQAIAAIWRQVLRVERVGLQDNFFDLGGHSVLLAQVHSQLQRLTGQEITMVDLFRYPTVGALAAFLSHETHETHETPAAAATGSRRAGGEIAIIGMAGRFPGAANVAEFWRNLCAGVESIAHFTDAELIEAGVDPAVFSDPRYVRAGGVLADADRFDAAFFGYTPRDAEVMDPQHRIFLETAWAALEDAGYNPADCPGRVGIYAGAGSNSYLLRNLAPNWHRLTAAGVGEYSLMTANGPDYLTTRAAYKLNLKGPSMTVQTACSTSLVAVHLACRSLAEGECELALAGGVSVQVPQTEGRRYQEGAVFSPDGHCRAFDADGQGTVFGSGVGLVVLKPLEAALADGDHIYAMIRGSAVNNDGSAKVGYTAPGIDGQAAVIAQAQAAAGVDAESVTYVETHGTGTPLGDPIEIAALTQAFRERTDAKQFCAIGSVKTNVGHLNSAAGVAGLIKTALALQHRQLPPSLHFKRPNPKIDFASSPFYVNTELAPWQSDVRPRRAGVSSFGFGGTNAHVLLEEAPPLAPTPVTMRRWQMLPLSARTPGALAEATANLAAHLREHPDANLTDVAYTLQAGRSAFAHRRAVIVYSAADAAEVLSRPDPGVTGVAGATPPPVAFLFPGQGAQQIHMGEGLYATEPVFRREMDRCAELLRPHLGLDLRAILYPAGPGSEADIDQTWLAQPALFATEYALARLWRSWGIQPGAMLGHSLGEYVAACLSGVFTLEAALALVAARGRLMQSMAPGAMLAVGLPEAELLPLLGPELDLATVNGPAMCVVAGPHAAVAALERDMTARGVRGRRLRTSHAYHSAMMAPALAPFAELVRQAGPRRPELPFISNLTGTWITPEQATDPEYWAQHLRRTVRFSAGLQTLLALAAPFLLEVGPGQGLTALARQQAGRGSAAVAMPSMPRQPEGGRESEALQTALGCLWVAGAQSDWAAVHGEVRPRRVSLPTYPFERTRYWIDPPRIQLHAMPMAEPVLNRHERTPETEYVAPVTEIEQIVAAVWQELLGIREVSVNDDFFALGGDSLILTQLAARLRDVFPLDLPLEQLFGAATVSRQAALLEELLINHLTEEDAHVDHK